VRLLEFLLVACLLAMIVMIFGNVVLRYGFDRSIVLSEELSRFAFIWMTFIGAILAAREGMHVGVDSLVVILPPWGRLACLVLSELLVVGCCAVFVWGTWRQHHVHATTAAPASGLSMIWVFGVGYLTGAGIALVSLLRLARIARGLQPEAAPAVHVDVA
jgi:TRAP-type C4-dicarboxylate transport system permease small subunit